ncbi:hypothetical protein KSP39_PZI010764 [Platanthera zijinensis]|uniref:Uncharacterized protein n=1 Tax=Platanthera zijinensis TaxID=2320716 RepID=A0AAP0BI54_9ASPA
MRLAYNFMEEMSEVILDAANRGKRRLPLWMQSNDMPKNKKCGNLDEISSTSENQKETWAAISRIESLSSQTDVVLIAKKKDPKNIENYSKKNIRKTKRGGGSKDSTDKFIRSKIKVEDDIIGKSNDEAELAVDDLLSIAEEFLNAADKVMLHDQSVTRKSDSFISNSFPVTPSPTLEEKLDGGIRSRQSLSKCNQTGESVCSSSSRVIQFGDAAQDMLELFLGPLLKKAPPLNESNPETARELRTANYESDGEV